jgi:hypothetical protein
MYICTEYWIPKQRSGAHRNVSLLFCIFAAPSQGEMTNARLTQHRHVARALPLPWLINHTAPIPTSLVRLVHATSPTVSVVSAYAGTRVASLIILPLAPMHRSLIAASGSPLSHRVLYVRTMSSLTEHGSALVKHFRLPARNPTSSLHHITPRYYTCFGLGTTIANCQTSISS